MPSNLRRASGIGCSEATLIVRDLTRPCPRARSLADHPRREKLRFSTYTDTLDDGKFIAFCRRLLHDDPGLARHRTNQHGLHEAVLADVFGVGQLVAEQLATARPREYTGHTGWLPPWGAFGGTVTAWTEQRRG